MRHLIHVIAVIAVVAGFTALRAQIIDDFEHGNTGIYNFTGGFNNLTIVPGAAFSGSLGAEFAAGSGPGWYWRATPATQPGFIYYAYVRFTVATDPSVANKRVYVGVGASSAGTWSMVAAPNTNQIILQNNSNFLFTNVATAPFTWSPDTWYRMELDWANDGVGTMQVTLWDAGRTTILAQTTPVATNFTTPGGYAFRGFVSQTGVGFSQLDEIGIVPEPASLVALGVLALAALRRRK